jgi:hypothetical protein
LFAQPLHSRDRRDGDQSGDKALFDGGSASFVTKQILEKLHGGLLVQSSVPGSTPLSLGQAALRIKADVLKKS